MIIKNKAKERRSFMYLKREIGKYGEEKAIEYIKKKGYAIIEKNFSCKQGEIDIIATNKEYLIFIEVKTRTNLEYGSPSESVNSIKQKHMYQSAKYYLYLHGLEKCFIRFDVVEVYISNSICRIHHIPQII